MDNCKEGLETNMSGLIPANLRDESVMKVYPIGSQNNYASLQTLDNFATRKRQARDDFTVNRPIYDQIDFDEAFDGGYRPSRWTARNCHKSLVKVCDCSTKCVKRTLKKTFPFVSMFETYNAGAFAYDAMAGLTIGIMHIPQGMAYSMLASLPAYYGLYVSFFAPLIYFFFGMSRQVSLGTFAVISLMVGNMVDTVCGTGEAAPTGTLSVEPLGTGAAGSGVTTGNPYNNTAEDNEHLEQCQLAVATAGTFVAGLIQIGLSLLFLGVIVIYLSEPLTRGFTTGAGMHVFSSQIKNVLGIEMARYSGVFKLVYTYRDVVLKVPEINPAAFITTVTCMTVLWITKEFINPHVKRRFKVPVPIELIVVVFGTLASAMGRFNERFHLSTVGYIPLGIPPPQFPDPNYFGDVVGDAFSLAIVSFAISISMSQVFAKKHNYQIDANQELLAHGLTNAVSANFNCYMSCVSLSRSMVQDTIGAQTQVAGLVSSALLLVVLMAVADLFEALPQCVLAAIVIVALKGIFLQFKDIKKYWKMSKTDLSVWVVTFVAVVLLDNTLGLLVGVAWSLVTVVGRTHRPYTCLLERAPGTELYKDVKSYSNLKAVPGVKVFRIEGSLYYANTAYVQAAIYHRTGCDPRLIRTKQIKIENRIKNDDAKRKRELEKLTKKHKKLGLPDPTWSDLPPQVARKAAPQPNIHHVVLDCSTVAWIDTQGVGMVTTVVSEYKQIGVTCLLAGCKGLVRQCLDNGAFFRKHKKSLLFATAHDAVLASMQPNGRPAELSVINETGETPIDGYDNKAFSLRDASSTDSSSDLDTSFENFDTSTTYL